MSAAAVIPIAGAAAEERQYQQSAAISITAGFLLILAVSEVQ